jgi:hypothetical protein
MKPKQLKFWPEMKRGYTWRAHAYDYGEQFTKFLCKRCGFDSGWTAFKSYRDRKRGLACPTCNKPKLKE